MEKIKETAKAWASLVSILVVSLGATIPEEPYARIIAVVGAIAGAILVWALPNQDSLLAAAQKLPDDPYPGGYAAGVADGDPVDERGAVDVAMLVWCTFVVILVIAVLKVFGLL